MAGYIKSHFKF